MAIHRGILTAQLILYDEVLCKNSYPLSTVIYFRNPVSIDLLKVNNRNTSIRCEICSNLTIKTPERRHWQVFGGWKKAPSFIYVWQGPEFASDTLWNRHNGGELKSICNNGYLSTSVKFFVFSLVHWRCQMMANGYKIRNDR